MSRILTSLHGRRLGLNDASPPQLIVPGGIVSGDHGSQFFEPSPTTYVQFDDFMGDTLNTFLWHNPTKGSDAGTADFAILQGVSGVIRGTTGAGAGATMAVNGILIDGGLDWKANSGGLYFQTRLKMSSLATIALFAGFTDQVSTLEMPINMNAGVAITTTATDAVGFVFDTNATTATWKLLGVANDVDATLQEAVQSTTVLTSAPTAAVYDTLRIEVSTAGVASFFLNGKQVGTKMTGAVTATVALTPCIATFVRAAISTTVDVDYIAVGSLRV